MGSVGGKKSLLQVLQLLENTILKYNICCNLMIKKKKKKSKDKQDSASVSHCQSFIVKETALSVTYIKKKN